MIKKVDELLSIHSMIYEKTAVKRSEHFMNTVNHSQIPADSVVSNPKANNTEFTKIISPTEVCEILPAFSSAPILSKTVPLGVPTKCP